MLTSSRFPGLVAVLLLALVACGSTAQERGTATDASGEGLSAVPQAAGGQPTGITVDGATPTGAAPSASTVPSGTPTPAADAPTATTTGSASAGAAAAGPTTGRGFTEDEIRIGYLTWNDVSNAGSAVGYAVDYGDQERIAQAIADDLNSRGGIAGRKVVMVFYNYETGQLLADGPAADQAACSKFVEDEPVYAVIAVTGPQSEVLPQCLYDNQITLIANDNIPYPRQWFEQWHPFIYSTANPMQERLFPIWLQRSDAVGYFTGWDTTTGEPSPAAPVKIGVVRANAPTGEGFRDIVAAALADLGYELSADYAHDSAFDTNGMSSAVLQFRSAGITHVLVESLFFILWPQTAESQQYRPRYSLTTANAPLLVQDPTPAEQLEGAVGVGYFPSYDVGTAQDPGDPSPAAAHCREIQDAAGNDPNQRESWNLQAKACDAFALIAEAAARAGGLHTTAIADGASRIDSIAPSGAFGIVFGGRRQDGPGAVRDLAYDMACTCFVFSSPTNHPLA
jgi:ABC-type branched-subunit amino acid transport system substrate-binding protein